MEPNGEPKQGHPYMKPEWGSAGAAGQVRDNPSISVRSLGIQVNARQYLLSLLSVNEILLSIFFLEMLPRRSTEGN